MNTHKNMVLVHDILNSKFMYVDIDKILAVEVKPFITDPSDGVKKQCKAAIILDTANNSKIIIDETVEELFTRIAVGTGCIKLPLERISRMNSNKDTSNDVPHPVPNLL